MIQFEQTEGNTITLQLVDEWDRYAVTETRQVINQTLTKEKKDYIQKNILSLGVTEKEKYDLVYYGLFLSPETMEMMYPQHFRSNFFNPFL